MMIAIDKRSKGKTADSKRIKAEDLPRADEETVTIIRDIIDLIIKKKKKLHGSQLVEKSSLRPVHIAGGEIDTLQAPPALPP